MNLCAEDLIGARSHSSQILYLCSMKCSSEMLFSSQNCHFCGIFPGPGLPSLNEEWKNQHRVFRIEEHEIVSMPNFEVLFWKFP